MREKIIEFLMRHGISLVFLGTSIYLFLKGRKKVSPIKESLLDLIGNTPIIHLKSLSKLTGCNIYVS